MAVDFRLNLHSNDERVKFQPDLVALSQREPLVPLKHMLKIEPDGQLEPVLFLDYESQNSSDIRIPEKDVMPYEEWSKVYGKRVPYIIVTTLPNKRVKEWKVWKLRTETNSEFRGRRVEICKNPFRFWYEYYRIALKDKDLNMIYFINIDGKTVSNVTRLLQSDESLLSH